MNRFHSLSVSPFKPQVLLEKVPSAAQLKIETVVVVVHFSWVESLLLSVL